MSMISFQREALISGMLVWLAAATWGQDTVVERAAVKLADPSRPGIVKLNLVNGSITVKGYEGKEVLVETNQRGLKTEESDNEVTILPGPIGPTELRLSVPLKTSLQLRCANG